MQVNAQQTDPCTLVLDITLDAEQVSRAFDGVYREFSRYANVPGFRPGKAPRAVLERYIDRERVRERTLEKLVGDSYAKALKELEEQNITPYRNPDIQPPDLEDKQPFTYKAVVPLEPQVTLGEYKGLTVEKPIFAVTDAMIDERIQRLRDDRARLERVTDRGVQAGDVLIADVQVAQEGEENPAPSRRQLIQTGNNIPGFDEAIMGMSAGEERTFTLTYPEDFTEEERRGKKATFTVKLHSISARKLPDLDGEFAKQAAGVETVEDLRIVLRERMEAELTRLSDQLAEQRVLQEIVNRATIHFPQVLVREEVEENLRQLANDLRQAGMTYQQFLEQSGKTAEEHQAQLAAQAEVRVRTLLVLHRIAVQENLQVTDEQIDAEFDRMLNEGRITEEQYDTYQPEAQRRLQVANALIQQQLHDFLFAHNTFTPVEQDLSPETENEVTV
ncbi:MAG TPA: trigger factor [Chthonomonadaceae bacterium]|nr:trigger factor [Chthonomonadaceae bacterium]